MEGSAVSTRREKLGGGSGRCGGEHFGARWTPSGLGGGLLGAGAGRGSSAVLGQRMEGFPQPQGVRASFSPFRRGISLHWRE